MTQVGVDPQWRDAMARVLDVWEQRGLVADGWTVEHDAGDGAYRATFRQLAPTGEVRAYSMTEAEFCQYVIGAADIAPAIAGPAACALADQAREVTE